MGWRVGREEGASLDGCVPVFKCFLMGPLMSEKFVSFFKLMGFSANLVGNLMGISGIGGQISGI